MYTETKIPSRVHRHHHFDTISELLSYINNTPISPIFSSRSQSSLQTGHYHWYGTSSFEEALDLLRKGWCPEAQKLSEKVPIKTTPSQFNSQRPTHSVVGYQASVPRYLQGIPTNMITSKPTPKKQKIIVLYKSISYNSHVSTEEIEREGVKALQIIQALEGRGYRVKLNTLWCTNRGSESAAFSVTVKKPQDRLSLIKMAFPLIHPSMLRRIGFAWLERNHKITDYGFNYAYGVSDSDKFIPQKGEIVLPSFIPNVGEFVNSLKLS